MAQFIRLCVLWTILTTIAILLLAVVVAVGVCRMIWELIVYAAEKRFELIRNRFVD